MYRTVFGITLIFLMICQSVEAQSTISRLIGTKSEINYFAYGWTEYDSTRYVYSTFGAKHQTPYYSELHPALVGRLPLYYGPNATLHYSTPYYTSGMGPFGTEGILYNPDSWMADSIIYYWYDTNLHPLEWDSYQIINRHFENNAIDSTYFSFLEYATTNLTIKYNDKGQPTEQFVQGSISSSKYTFTQSDIGLLGYISWNDSYGDLRKFTATDYTLDSLGRPTEELHRIYDASIETNPSHIESRMTYAYNPSGLVSNRTGYISGAEGFIAIDSFNYYYNNNQLQQYEILHRSVDTSTVPTEIGEWWSPMIIDLYYTDDKIDSVIRHKKYDIDLPVELNLCEYFQYHGDYISSYIAKDYFQGTVSEYHNITNTYDASNRISKCSWFIEYSTYCTQTDTLYTYFDQKNIILKEVFRNNGYDYPCSVNATTPISRYYYYYEDVPVAGESASPLLMQVFPSPADNTLTIQIVNSSGSVSDQLIRVIDIFGQLVYSATLPASATYQAINCSTWASGLYIVALEQDGLLAKQKIIVK